MKVSAGNLSCTGHLVTGTLVFPRILLVAEQRGAGWWGAASLCTAQPHLPSMMRSHVSLAAVLFDYLRGTTKADKEVGCNVENVGKCMILFVLLASIL